MVSVSYFSCTAIHILYDIKNTPLSVLVLLIQRMMKGNIMPKVSLVIFLQLLVIVFKTWAFLSRCFVTNILDFIKGRSFIYGFVLFHGEGKEIHNSFNIINSTHQLLHWYIADFQSILLTWILRWIKENDLRQLASWIWKHTSNLQTRSGYLQRKHAYHLSVLSELLMVKPYAIWEAHVMKIYFKKSLKNTKLTFKEGLLR